jgi:hypothetical protein
MRKRDRARLDNQMCALGLVLAVDQPRNLEFEKKKSYARLRKMFYIPN